SPFTIHHSPFTIHHSPFTIHHSPFTIHHSPFTIHHSPFTIHHLPFTIYRSPFTPPIRPMLTELTIRDFAIIDELHLQIAPGFNVLTGETGAGKSIILDAVMLILGGRADTTMIRSGAEQATVEARFHLEPYVAAAVQPLLTAEGLEGDSDDELLLARELRQNGRNICRINGRSVPLTLIRQIGENLIDIHGQGEHLSLLKPKAHLPLLDAYANLGGEQRTLATEVSAYRKIQRELADLRQNEKLIAQRIDMLHFQIEEIDAAKLTVGEEEELKSERKRLGNMEQLNQLVAALLSLFLGADVDASSVTDMLSQAERAMGQLVRLDDTQATLLPRLQGLISEFQDISGELQHYLDRLEFDPERAIFVEERLELINRLKRKYGDDITTILQSRTAAATELDKLTHSEERIGELEQEQEKYLRRIGLMAEALSQKRRAAAKNLAQGVVTELADLQMQGSAFEVNFQRSPAKEGAYVGEERFSFDESGIDQGEFLVSANPGEPVKPMAKVASGGETARLMLALKTVLAQVDSTPTLIFDEIDQGIGGRVGDTVGNKLWGLAAHGGHQVIVVTHLPQLAGYGDVHFHVSKGQNAGRTITHVRQLNRSERVNELAAMLGTHGEHARSGAMSILAHANNAKGKTGIVQKSANDV
ncbi:MAG: DNA repair protein RecN, partial [Chloroflexi bacterium]|nr:DNA repair protein RecN [Chloroflexota bacterium]